MQCGEASIPPFGDINAPEGDIIVAVNWFYVLAALLVVLIAVNIVCLMRTKSLRSKSYKAVRVYDSEDQSASIPIS